MPQITKSEFFRKNRDNLRRLMSEQQIPAAIIAGHSFVQASADRSLPFEQDGSFFYLTGLNEPGLVLVIRDDEEYLIVPGRSEARVAFEGATDFSKLINISGVATVLDEKEGWNLLSAELQKTGKAGIMMPAEEYLPSMDIFTNPSRRRIAEKLKTLNEKTDFADLRPAVVSLRMIKSDYEISLIEKAISTTADMLADLQKKLEQADNERDLMAAASYFAVKNGQPFAYDPIIAGGMNAVTLHYEENNSPLDKAELLLLDIGLKYEGYSADITRTISTGGLPSDRQKQVYDAVLDVHGFAINILKPGITIKDYEEQVVGRMGEKLVELGLIDKPEKDAIRSFYPHATSHFLGIDVHDVADYKRPLEAGMILTVEPGIYIAAEKIGVRIEDDILITKDGNRNLSKSLPRSPSGLTIKT